MREAPANSIPEAVPTNWSHLRTTSLPPANQTTRQTPHITATAEAAANPPSIRIVLMKSIMVMSGKTQTSSECFTALEKLPPSAGFDMAFTDPSPKRNKRYSHALITQCVGISSGAEIRSAFNTSPD